MMMKFRVDRADPTAIAFTVFAGEDADHLQNAGNLNLPPRLMAILIAALELTGQSVNQGAVPPGWPKRFDFVLQDQHGVVQPTLTGDP